MKLLEAINISKTFPINGQKLTVLHNISLNIEKGELLAITGKSGSGKSTLMKILGCLDVPTTGTYLIEGKNTLKMKPDQLAHIRNSMVGFAFQRFFLLPDLSALDNVSLPQLYAGKKESDAKKRATEMLKLVSLAHRINHYPAQLSGGELQRVAIARALVNNPPLILADEPTGNLDSKTGDHIMNIFIRLNQEQAITVVIITHDISLAQKTNRIITLQDGRII